MSCGKKVCCGVVRLARYCYKVIVILLQRFVGRYLIKINRNCIAFMSIPDYSDNAKALSDYILSLRDEKYEIIWFVEDPEGLHKKYINLPINFYSSKKNSKGIYSWNAIKAAYSCKRIFFTHKFIISKKWCKRRQEIYNLWHGCGYKASERRLQKKINEYFDYVLVPGPIYVDIKAKFFGAMSNTVLPIGYPRYDKLLNESESARKYVKQLLGDMGKIIIWMPTFRRAIDLDYPEAGIQKEFELPIVNSLNELKEVNTICKENSILLCIKRHPFQKLYSCEGCKFSNILFLDSNDFERANIELYSFLRYTDALISDYSSVAIDYLILDKPIGFGLDDFEQYSELRGFVFDNPLDYMPGHHIYTHSDLKKFIIDVASGQDPYKDSRAKIMPEVHNLCDNYCERVWRAVKELSEYENYNKKIL